jgi:DNA-binding beta-propeller fold protein YncE
MFAQTGRPIWFLRMPLFLVAVFGLCGVRSFLAPAQGAVNTDTLTQLASVSVPVQPNSLAWSADGRYLAAGTWGSTTDDAGSYEVYILDVAKASILNTLKPTSPVEGLAFSPDGKWLAVAGRPSIPVGGTPDSGTPAELVVFDIPAFTARFTAKAGASQNGFIDLAWAADSLSLHAIDGPPDYTPGTAEVRRWAVPAFTELEHPIRATQNTAYTALAVSPDGRTLAVVEPIKGTATRMIRLFDLGEGTERLSLKAGNNIEGVRLGFTPDGKAVGAFDTNRLSWWDVATGRPAEPRAARFAVQPAGLSYLGSRAAVSPDGSWQAWGYERHRGLGDLGLDFQEKKYGGFVKVTESATGKSRTWRVSGAQYPPAVAFSPDGTKLAGTVWQPIQPGSRPGSDQGSILIWAVPK